MVIIILLIGCPNRSCGLKTCKVDSRPVVRRLRLSFILRVIDRTRTRHRKRSPRHGRSKVVVGYDGSKNRKGFSPLEDKINNLPSLVLDDFSEVRSDNRLSWSSSFY